MKPQQEDQGFFSNALHKLAGAFNRATDAWDRIGHLGALKNSCFTAIQEGDAAGLGTALQALGRDEFLYDEKVKLVRAAIDSRNLAVFRVMIDFIDDPNFEMKVNYLSTKPGQGTYHNWSPLSYALTFAHSHDIAMHLANDPRTRTSHQDVLNARKAGMQDVADALERAPLGFTSAPQNR